MKLPIPFHAPGTAGALELPTRYRVVVMKAISCLWVLLLSTSLAAQAQQLLCERELRTNAPGIIQPAALLRLQPDSLRLMSDRRYPAGTSLALQTRLQRLNLGNCDTLPAGPTVSRVSQSDGRTNLATVNRRGQVLVAQILERPLAAASNRDSARIVLQLFNRNGTPRWRRVVPPQSYYEGASGLIEAPGGGFYVCGSQANGRGSGNPFLFRIDSLGQVQWRRTYRRVGVALENPNYTRTGNLVFTAAYTPGPGLAGIIATLEINQQGDSVTTRPVTIVPQQYTRPPFLATNALWPLRDGGFALVGQVDSANTGYFRPFLARLDRNLNLTWSYVYRPQATQNLRFVQPQELADGTLVVVASNAQSGRGYPFWLFRFSATGALQQTYPFVSQVLTANTSGGRYGFFGVAQGLQPLSDSSFVVVAGGSDTNSSRVYLAHLRVPGLPRVIDSHYVPAAQPLATRPGRAGGAGLALYPNPARETVTVRYPPLGGPAPATLVLSDVLGRTVLAQPLPPGTTEATVSVRGLPAGLYQATVRAGGRVVASGKLAVGE